MLPVVEEVVKQYTIAEMSRIAEEIEIPFSPVARPRDLFDDPQLNANGRMLNVELNEDVTSRVPRLPVEIGDHDLRLRRQPPKIGEHSREILSEIGVSEEQLAALAKQRIVIDMAATLVKLDSCNLGVHAYIAAQ